MLGLVCNQYGSIDELLIKNLEEPLVESGQVKVKVFGCGINFPDLLLVEGKYQAKPALPFVPGGEISGVIVEVGSDVTGWNVGERVMATVFLGGLQGYVVVDVGALNRIPSSMSAIQAAVFLGAYTTSYFALKQRASLQYGETLLVLGASGGVGLAALQLGKAMGANVIAAVGSETKASELKRLGFDKVINYDESDLRQQINLLTDSQGIDVVYDPVGGDLFEAAARSLRAGGRMLVVGFASGTIPKFPVNLALLKQISIVGVHYQEFYENHPVARQQNVNELYELFERGLISPHIHKIFPFEQSKQAIQSLATRQIVGKTVVAISKEV